MRKPFFILLAIFYLVLSAGVPVYYQYCRGRLAGVSLFGGDCPSCKEEGKCCRKCTTELEVVKITIDQLAPEGGDCNTPQAYAVHPLACSFHTRDLTLTPQIKNYPTITPCRSGLPEPPAWLVNRALRI